MFHTITSLLFLALLIYVIYTVWHEYREETSGTPYEKLWAACKDSGTILWNKFVLILAAVVAQLDNIADYFNMPDIKNYINVALGNPKMVALVMAAIASITVAARMRKGSNDPL